jgi:glycyl-tRNA synthetase
MSIDGFGLGGLRFWNESEINQRNYFIDRISYFVKEKLHSINNSWQFFRFEGTILTPRNYISKEYGNDDIFITQISKKEQELILRAETTASSYEYARMSNKKLPLCVWQSGKSFRVEKSDGASWGKLRANEFYQLEFQCIYSKTTKADYRSLLINELSMLLKELTLSDTVNIVESDRLPSYSNSTLDIEVPYKNKLKEIASISIRNDYSNETYVLEIAIGLDRMLEIYSNFK